jgi:acyl carrier protein
MDNTQILNSIQEILRDVADDDAIVINENSTADDVEGWDSLTHIQLVVAIEKQFKIKFTAAEIQKWKNVGEMIASIGAKGV